MSLSPIFSINKDFLVVAAEDGSDFGGFKLIELCSDSGMTLLISPAEEVFFLDRNEPVPFFTDSPADKYLFLDTDELFPFFIEGRETMDVPEEINSGFDGLGEENCGDLVTDDTGFFFVLGKSSSS